MVGGFDPQFSSEIPHKTQINIKIRSIAFQKQNLYQDPGNLDDFVESVPNSLEIYFKETEESSKHEPVLSAMEITDRPIPHQLCCKFDVVVVSHVSEKQQDWAHL